MPVLMLKIDELSFRPTGEIFPDYLMQQRFLTSFEMTIMEFTQSCL